MTQSVERTSLYDRDFLLWTEDTVAKLRSLQRCGAISLQDSKAILQDFQGLDLEHLIEEIESLGISQKKELLSRLTTLLEHILKRLYIPMSNDYNGWERTIREQRRGIRVLLDQMPSLKNFWDGFFPKAWNFAIKDLQVEYPQIQFPREWQFDKDIETMLDRIFWDTNLL
jgi:hypothetical protein